jgi:aspartyl/asparaginyl beta-hydroxylase (cupin superfamily)
LAPRSSLAEVDRLVAAGQLAAAAQRLEAMLLEGGGEAGQWLQLAGLRRALRQPRRALESVHRALEMAPLNFVALVMRAGLLERLEDPTAGEAWGEAIAQRPPESLPVPLATALQAGMRFHAAWLERREQRLSAAVLPMQEQAADDEAWRITRFRDNVLRKTKVFHSEPTHFCFPGLAEREFHPAAGFAWIAALEAEADAIRGEALALLRSREGVREPYIQYEDREALAQWRTLNRNPDWSAFHLLRRGEPVAANAGQAPRTMAALARLGQRRVPGVSPNAMFSLLAPRTTIPPHVGVDNTRLVCHLPLVVPSGCWFRVGAETRFWQEGKVLVFDDTIEHEATNPTGDLRIVLIFDIWHPGLSQVERDAVSAMIAAEGRVLDL